MRPEFTHKIPRAKGQRTGTRGRPNFPDKLSAATEIKNRVISQRSDLDRVDASWKQSQVAAQVYRFGLAGKGDKIREKSWVLTVLRRGDRSKRSVEVVRAALPRGTGGRDAALGGADGRLRLLRRPAVSGRRLVFGLLDHVAARHDEGRNKCSAAAGGVRSAASGCV